MCNRYIPPELYEIESEWHIGARHVPPWQREIFPRTLGPFVRPARGSGQRELVVGQWSLIPWFAKEMPLKYSTNNARSEELARKATFRDPWKRGQRCLIPAASFDEPNWESGKNVWWRFRRADGKPWALSGLWGDWTNKATGEVVESYIMPAMSANAHPLMSSMHKPDPKLEPTAQDKRSVIAINRDDWDTWLRGPDEGARELIRLTAIEAFDASPDDAP